MIDSQPRKKIKVSGGGTAGPPYIIVPVDQLARIQQSLDQYQIQYWVDSDSISLDGDPAVTFINLDDSEDAKKIQAILDDAA